MTWQFSNTPLPKEKQPRSPLLNFHPTRNFSGREEESRKLETTPTKEP
jgi:hypothetical protein